MNKTKLQCSPGDSLYFLIQSLLCSALAVVPAWIYVIIANTYEYGSVSTYDLGYQKHRAYVPILCFIIRNLVLYFAFMRKKVPEHYVGDSGIYTWLKFGLIYIVPSEIIRLIICCCSSLSKYLGIEVLQITNLFFSGDAYTKVYIPYFFVNLAVLMLMYRTVWNVEEKKRNMMKCSV